MALLVTEFISEAQRAGFQRLAPGQQATFSIRGQTVMITKREPSTIAKVATRVIPTAVIGIASALGATELVGVFSGAAKRAGANTGGGSGPGAAPAAGAADKPGVLDVIADWIIAIFRGGRR